MPALRVHPTNPRYFDNGAGRALYLAGSHHWDVLVDNAERPGGLDFEGFLDRLESWGHNVLRVWALEAWVHEVRPTPWPRTGPGTALDGGPRFDLSRFDPHYFERLRARVARAGERGFFAAVMLFNGWSTHDNGEGNPWFRHPFNRLNNVNGIDGDPDARGDGLDVHTLRLPTVTRLQEAYARRVVEAVGDLGHVLWEVSNESPGESVDWQYHFVRVLKTLSARPVGMTSCFPRGRNEDLFRSPADWISPNRRGGYMKDPPPADGRKVILLDTDHLWGIGGDRRWVWKAFLRGHHPLYMDPLDADPEREAARRALGHTRRLAERLDLAAMIPDPDRCSTGYCLAGPGEALVYLPRGRGKVDLAPLPGMLMAEWIDPASGLSMPAGRIAGGRSLRLRAPFRGKAGDAVLRLRASAGTRPPSAP